MAAMTASLDDLLQANERYAAGFTGTELPGQAARGLAMVTCMDSRIDPLAMVGLQKGDAKILRNAGGRVTDDVLRTLVLAVHLLGVSRVLVVQHTDCRMTKVTDEQAHEAIRDVSGLDTRSLEFHTIPDQKAALRRDVERIRAWPYLPRDLTVAGGVYDVHTGRLEVLVDP
jgi:carbonic anhydrase